MDSIVIIDDSNIMYQKTNQEKMTELLDVLTDEELKYLEAEINDEKELRKLKKHRSEKLKIELRQEKTKLLKEMNSMKMKMLQNMDIESSSEEETVKKPYKKTAKPVNRKTK